MWERTWDERTAERLYFLCAPLKWPFHNVGAHRTSKPSVGQTRSRTGRTSQNSSCTAYRYSNGTVSGLTLSIYVFNVVFVHQSLSSFLLSRYLFFCLPDTIFQGIDLILVPDNNWGVILLRIVDILTKCDGSVVNSCFFLVVQNRWTRWLTFLSKWLTAGQENI